MKLVVSVLALIICTTLLCSCNSAQSTPTGAGMPAMLVKTAVLEERVLPESSTFVGTLKSRKSINMRPQVEGRIVRILVRSGDEVKQGTPLIELDRIKQQAVVSNVSAQIESLVAEQENARSTVESLKASKVSREARLKLAELQLARYQKLADQGAVSTEAVDNWRSQLNATQAEVESTDGQIRAQQAILNKAAKLIKQSHASMSEQTEQLHYFTVRAPFAGQVGDIPVRVGDFVTTDTTLTSVDQTRPLELYVNIPTTDSKRLRKGLVAQILNDDGTVDQFGEVFFVDAHVDPKDQSVLVKAEIGNPKETLRSGQQVNARLMWGNAPAVTVPVTAVTRFTGQDFVFIAEKGADGKVIAKQKPVKLAQIEGNEYKVINGLKAGDEVVVSGTQNLTDGAPIKTAS